MQKTGKNQYRCVCRCHTCVFTALFPYIGCRVQWVATVSHDSAIQRWQVRQWLRILGSRTVGKQCQAQTGCSFVEAVPALRLVHKLSVKIRQHSRKPVRMRRTSREGFWKDELLHRVIGLPHH